MSMAGLVLAAGESRRLGRPKALLEVGGETLLARSVRVLREGGCADVVVVSGSVALVVPGARVIDNPDWATGMGSSLRVGLRVIDRADAVVIMVVDTPGIGADVVRRLRRAHRDGASLVVATYDGAPRNPVLIGRRHWAEVLELAVDDVGARAFLAQHPELVRQVECGDIADPRDIDTPDDLARVLGGPRGS
jgi:CTP:molybdopterin cytidylyltransferase MocA